MKQACQECWLTIFGGRAFQTCFAKKFVNSCAEISFLLCLPRAERLFFRSKHWVSSGAGCLWSQGAMKRETISSQKIGGRKKSRKSKEDEAKDGFEALADTRPLIGSLNIPRRWVRWADERTTFPRCVHTESRELADVFSYVAKRTLQMRLQPKILRWKSFSLVILASPTTCNYNGSD